MRYSGPTLKVKNKGGRFVFNVNEQLGPVRYAAATLQGLSALTRVTTTDLAVTMTWKGCERDKIQGWPGTGRGGARHHPRVDRGTDRNPFDQVPVNILPGHG